MFSPFLALIPLVSSAGMALHTTRHIDHPNFDQLVEVLDATQDEASKLIPNWVIKDLPRIDYLLVDREETLNRHHWPAAMALGGTKRDPTGRETRYTVEIPAGSLIADPARGRGALVRDIVYCAGMETAMTSGGGFSMMGDLMNNNPVIMALASFIAGELDAETEYLLGKHLNTDAELEACFAEIDPDESGGGSAWNFKDRPKDDVTFLILARYLTPKGNDKKLSTLYTAIKRGQPVEGALKKATKKKLKKLNPELRKAFTKFLDERFPAKERELYRQIVASEQGQQWSDVVDSADRFLEDHGSSMAAPSAAWLRARAMVEVDPEIAAVALTEFLETYGSRCAFAWEAQLHLGQLANERGDHAAARALIEQLERDFGWIPDVQAIAEKELKSLDG